MDVASGAARGHLLRDELLRRGLRLPQLRLLVALQDTGQVSGAAAQMSMTQPAASRLLSELERMVDARLYDRHARGVTLTPAGETLAARAREILYRLDQVQTEIAALTSGVHGLVRIGSVTGPAVDLILPLIRDLRIAYPEIELSVHVDTSDKLGEALLSRDLDFYIGRVMEGVDRRAIRLEPIGPEPVSLIVRNGHPLTRREDITLADCLHYDWIMQEEGGLLRRTARDYLLSHGYEQPKRILSTSSTLLTLAIISETNAIAPIATAASNFYASPSAFGGGIHRLKVAQDMVVDPYSLVLLRDHEASPAMLRVLDLLRQKIRRRYGGDGTLPATGDLIAPAT
ncbi:LysR family transcriptional regulator [Acuticoccus sediminis]|uniref:LysR family transcriptional regulator n=1 Tax=Acuticoccus sediminis TaxID=2184697 RepID=A0A8B2NLN7_9HYPH|nr:LysR family transcriptional regulator [Acuticoccus sediminis]RAH99015.1 LysR family transcriptional regulator [Acuticoccus sediminis]